MILNNDKIINNNKFRSSYYIRKLQNKVLIK